MPNLPLTKEVLERTATVYRETLFNVSETARIIGISRVTLRYRLSQCRLRGYLSEDEGVNDPNVPQRGLPVGANKKNCRI